MDAIKDTDSRPLVRDMVDGVSTHIQECLSTILPGYLERGTQFVIKFPIVVRDGVIKWHDTVESPDFSVHPYPIVRYEAEVRRVRREIQATIFTMLSGRLHSGSNLTLSPWVRFANGQITMGADREHRIYHSWDEVPL